MQSNVVPNNLDKIAQKIYDEGIARAAEEADSVRAKAQEEANQIIKQAKQEAETIVKTAKEQAEKLKKTAISEIQLNSKKLISELQSRLAHMISDRIASDQKNKEFPDTKLLSTLLTEIVGKWKPDQVNQLIVDRKFEQEIKKYLKAEVPAMLEKLVIPADENPERALLIVKASEGYELRFSEDDFRAFFTPYFTAAVRDLIFKSDG